MELNLIKNLLQFVAPLVIGLGIIVVVVFKFIQNKRNNKNIKQKNTSILSFKSENKNTINYKE